MKHHKSDELCLEKHWVNVTEEVSAVLGLEEYIIIRQGEGTYEQRHKEMKHCDIAQYNGSWGCDLLGGGEE